MRRPALLSSCLSIITLACSPGSIGNESADTSSTDTSNSSSDSGPSEATTDDESSTDTDEEADACPVDPELGNFQVLLDGYGIAIEHRENDGGIEWTHSCTVTGHTGALASGETIELECTDEQGQAIEHTLELLVELDGAPLEAPVSVGQQVELALWLRVWFAGTVAWTLRDAEGELLLLHYDGPFWPEPSAIGSEFAPPLEHLAPLTVGVNMEVCPLVCPEQEESGGFAPFEDCCSQDTALRLDLGDGSVQVQARSGATIPGPAGAHAIVGTSVYTDLDTCGGTDGNSEYYDFLIISG